jgi:type IV secretory pathway VirB10-like protein
MSFFGTITAVVVLTTAPVFCCVLAAEAQRAPAPAGQPQSPPPSNQPQEGQPQPAPPSADAPQALPSTPPPAPDERSRPAPRDPGQRQKVEGTVQSVEGSTMKLQSTDGHTVVVDLSRVSTRVYEIATRGETVTVIGVVAPGSDRLTAQAVVGDLKR